MHIRKLNILTHRYLSYYFVVLTVIYCISGVAVNHMEDWNPSYSISYKNVVIPPLKDKEEISEEEVKSIFSKLELEKTYNKENIFYPSNEMIQVILSTNEKITINITDNKVNYEIVTRRAFFHLFNFLHLNKPKKLWTYYADFYAISLLLITITGMFMKKGKEGFWGKGIIIILSGIVVPLIFVLMYY